MVASTSKNLLVRYGACHCVNINALLFSFTAPFPSPAHSLTRLTLLIFTPSHRADSARHRGDQARHIGRLPPPPESGGGVRDGKIEMY